MQLSTPRWRVDDSRLWIKFADDAGIRVAGQYQLSAHDGAGAELRALNRGLAAHEIHVAPAISLPDSELSAWAERARQRSGRRQPDLGGLIFAALPDGLAQWPPEVVDTFERSPLVEFIESRSDRRFEISGGPEPRQENGDLPPETPNFRDRQSHLGSEIGIDAEWAHAQGHRGAGIGYADTQLGWWIAHEDFDATRIVPEAGQTPVGSEFGHGTAVIGTIYAGHNAYGIDGIAPDLTRVRLYPEVTREAGERRLDAIARAFAQSANGDIVTLSMQELGDGGGLGPAELSASVWMLTRVAVDSGIVVVAPAGNGAQDLDAEIYDFYREWGDSGAILVGAGTADSRHAPLPFTTFGSRIDLQGFGAMVTTTGIHSPIFDGDGDTQRQCYCSDFNGSSAAAAMVAGAAIVVQGAAKSQFSRVLNSEDMRAVLVASGIADQSPTIGPLPNVRAAIEALEHCHDSSPPVIDSQIPATDLSVVGPHHDLRVQVAAHDDVEVRRVYLEVAGERAGLPDLEPPYELDVRLGIGRWPVAVIVEDDCGNQTRSLPIFVEVRDIDGEDSGETDGGDEGGLEAEEEASGGSGTGGDDSDSAIDEDAEDEGDGAKAGDEGGDDGDDGDDGLEGAGLPGEESSGDWAAEDAAAGCRSTRGVFPPGPAWLSIFFVLKATSWRRRRVEPSRRTNHAG